jgi:hypothetical protein
VIIVTAIDKLISIAEAEVGYLEKASNSQLDSKTANAGDANYTKYWRDIAPDYQGQAWCACFVTWCFVQAFGQAMAKSLLKHYPYVYCPTMASLFTLNANPQRGDIVIFYRSGTFTHTGIVTSVDGDKFTTIEGNTSGGSTIIANGGGVCQKSYYNSNLTGTKFCTPNYELVEEEIDMDELNKLAARVNALEEKANEPEMIYNYIDANMPSWAHEAVQWCVDMGIIKGTDDSGSLGLNDNKLWQCVVMYRLAHTLKTA